MCTYFDNFWIVYSLGQKTWNCHSLKYFTAIAVSSFFGHDCTKVRFNVLTLSAKSDLLPIGLRHCTYSVLHIVVATTEFHFCQIILGVYFDSSTSTFMMCKSFVITIIRCNTLYEVSFSLSSICKNLILYVRFPLFVRFHCHYFIHSHHTVTKI